MLFASRYFWLNFPDISHWCFPSMTDRWWDFLCNWITLTGHAWTKVQGPQKWLLSSVLKWLKLLVWVVAVCIILALSKFSLANWFGILWKKHKKRQYYDSEGCPHPLKGKVEDKKNVKNVYFCHIKLCLGYWWHFNSLVIMILAYLTYFWRFFLCKSCQGSRNWLCCC